MRPGMQLGAMVAYGLVGPPLSDQIRRLDPTSILVDLAAWTLLAACALAVVGLVRGWRWSLPVAPAVAAVIAASATGAEPGLQPAGLVIVTAVASLSWLAIERREFRSVRTGPRPTDLIGVAAVAAATAVVGDPVVVSGWVLAVAGLLGLLRRPWLIAGAVGFAAVAAWISLIALSAPVVEPLPWLRLGIAAVALVVSVVLSMRASSSMSVRPVG